MIKSILNIGTALDRSEQRNIFGGLCQYQFKSGCEEECSVTCKPLKNYRNLFLDEHSDNYYITWLCDDTPPETLN
jgi:hypothetical protein